MTQRSWRQQVLPIHQIGAHIINSYTLFEQKLEGVGKERGLFSKRGNILRKSLIGKRSIMVEF